MMEAGFQITMTSKEILIVAALLGYESVFGIDEEMLSEETIDLKALVRQSVDELEQRRLIRYELDGTLYIVSELRQAIDCICCAEIIGLFSTNLKSGKKASVYVMEKESLVATLMHLKGEMYQIHLTSSIPLQEFVPREILSSEQHPMKEMMLFEEAEYVHELIQGFNYDDAERRLKKQIKDESLSDSIIKILTGNCGYMSIQIHKKNQDLYNTIYNSLVVLADNHAVSLHSDENDVLFFESQAPSWIVDHIYSHFQLKQKRGAD